MTGAIVHVSKIRPLHLIAPEEVQVMEDLLFDRRREGYDPLQALLAMFAERKAADAVKKVRAETVEGRLKDRIVDGDRKGLGDELDEALKTNAPLDIINNVLLDGMKVVGELFGAGKMQLPFVLQSAETMKAAVAHLEPHMERVEGQEKGTIVLATVKGDVARHWQEPGGHHPDQQRLPGGQPGHQGRAGRHGRRRQGAPRPRHRHERAAGEEHRGDAREPGGDGAPGPRHPRHARRRRADTQLRGGGLRAGLCLRGAWCMRGMPSTGCT